MTHFYIAGFKYNPSSTNVIAASLIRLTGAAGSEVLNDGLVTADFITDASPNGPKLTISNYGGALKYIKIGLVLTVIIDDVIYPTSNVDPLIYSGVFMKYTLFNVVKPLFQGAALTGENEHYIPL